MNPTITLTDKPDPAHVKAQHALLLSFNNSASGYAYDGRPLVISVTHPESGEVLGGLFGATAYGYLHVDMLFVPESLRGSGLGSRLMQQAEDEAVRRGCHGSYLDTFDFQARGFYERIGYAVFGQIDDMPRGHIRFFLRKTLA
ncbi:MAG TPA: GNAT family N-acetyltransferase [Acidobacteriaceae bacterium]|nr:GNAT family N-acetyltransferase [Acidobacteriaceae bacterium]